MTTNKQLYDLQELDWKILAASTSLAEVRAKLQDRSEITSATQRVAQFSARLEDVTSGHRAVERTISDLEERLGRVETRLYGGAVTNARELDAAQGERTFFVEHKGEEEDKLLELMVEMEEVQGDLTETQQRLAELEASRPAEEAQLQKSEAQLSVELSELGGSRDQITPVLPASALSLYESLTKSRGGHAVARVERGMCQGCRLHLSTMELQKARSPSNIVRCSSCRRILYVV